MNREAKTALKLKKVNKILNRYRSNAGTLIHILQDIQSEYNYLPKDAIILVAKKLALPVSQIYSVANFYNMFSLEPRGRHIINICLGTACHVRGAARILETFQRELGIEPGGTTEDLRFTLETVNCVGACALGPVVVIDGEYFGEMTPAKVETVLKEFE
jgi:NADH-quinone oxidoreductase subunit E